MAKRKLQTRKQRVATKGHPKKRLEKQKKQEPESKPFDPQSVVDSILKKKDGV